MCNFWIEIYFMMYITFGAIHTICLITPHYRKEVVDSGFRFFSLIIIIIPIILFLKSISNLTMFDKSLFALITLFFILDGFMRKKK